MLSTCTQHGVTPCTGATWDAPGTTTYIHLYGSCEHVCSQFQSYRSQACIARVKARNEHRGVPALLLLSLARPSTATLPDLSRSGAGAYRLLVALVAARAVEDREQDASPRSLAIGWLSVPGPDPEPRCHIATCHMAGMP